MWRAWQVAPLIVTVAGGPLITIVYQLTAAHSVPDGSFSFAQAVRGALCLLMFLAMFLSRRVSLLEHRIILPLTALAAYALLSSPSSEYPYENVAFAVKLIFCSLVFACSFNVVERRFWGRDSILVCAWAVLGAMAVSQVIGFVTGNTARMYASAYATAGVISQPAIASALIISTLPVFLKYMPAKHAWVGVFVTLACLCLTMRRTAVLSATCAIVAVLIYNLHTCRHGTRARTVVLPMVLLAVFLIAFLHSEAGTDLLTRMADLDPRSGTGSGRYTFWAISAEHLAERGVLWQVVGEGMGTVRDVIGREFALSVGNHNAWLDLTHAFGIFGLAAILCWFLGLIRFGRHLQRHDPDTFQGVLAIILVMLLESIGQGGFADPSFAVVYAALGAWAGSYPSRGKALSDARRSLGRVV